MAKHINNVTQSNLFLFSEHEYKVTLERLGVLFKEATNQKENTTIEEFLNRCSISELLLFMKSETEYLRKEDKIVLLNLSPNKLMSILKEAFDFNENNSVHLKQDPEVPLTWEEQFFISSDRSEQLDILLKYTTESEVSLFIDLTTSEVDLDAIQILELMGRIEL